MYSKRLFDFIFALLGLLVFSGVLIVIYILASWDTRSNGLFFQQRIGQHGRVFTIYKFKTLHSQTGHISGIGRFLRYSKLDELPQLWNVLIGDMSLIGSRPLLPEYLEVQKRRHEVRPGITGWAQVNGRNAISWKQKFEYDVWYVDNINLFIDIKILFLTMKKVFVREGISQEGQATMEVFKGNYGGLEEMYGNE